MNTEPSASALSYGEMPDEEILRRYVRDGDRQALEALFRRYADSAYRIACRFTGNPTDAEDAVQTAFLSIMEKAGQFREESNARKWIVTILFNACRSEARSSSRRRKREEVVTVNARTLTEDGEAEVEKENLKERVFEMIQQLPEKYRMPVWLHYREGFSAGDIAETLAIPEKTIRSQIERGLNKLRESLAYAGVTTSAVAVTTMISSSTAEAAPATLIASIPAIAAGKVSAGSSVLAITAKSAKAAFWFKVKIAAALIAVAASATAVGIFGFGARTKTESFQNLPATWTFEKGVPENFIVLPGQESAWHWEKPSGGSTGGLALTHKFTSSGTACMQLPVKAPKRPFAVMVKFIPIEKAGYGMFVGWYAEGTVWPASTGSTFVGEGDVVDFEEFFLDRWVFTFANGKMVGFYEYKIPYPDDRLHMSGGSILVKSIQVKEVSLEEIPESIRDPEAFLKKLKAPAK